VIDKTRLLDALRMRVDADLEALERRQRDAQAGSTHEESRAEHAKDTRATEQSYLARGLADRVGDLRRTVGALATLQLEAFEPSDPIGVTAIVTISVEDVDVDVDVDAAHDGCPEPQVWWILAAAGGFELEQDGMRVRTVTPASPLGRALVGLRIGEEASYRTPRGERAFEVRALQ